MASTPSEMYNPSLKEVSPLVTVEDEQSAPALGEMVPITEQVEKPCLTITLEERRDIVESMLGMNFDEIKLAPLRILGRSGVFKYLLIICMTCLHPKWRSWWIMRTLKRMINNGLMVLVKVICQLVN